MTLAKEEILLDAENITLEQVHNYLWQRHEREENGILNAQDHLFGLLAELIVSQENESFYLDPIHGLKSQQNNDIHAALEQITERLDALDGKVTPLKKESVPRTMQLAKARCQAVAKYLWKLSPDMTQAEMAQHEAIYNIGITDGKRYEMDTIKKWIAEVDQRPAEKKRGRPRKAKK